MFYWVACFFIVTLTSVIFSDTPIFDHRSLPRDLQENLKDPAYRPTREDRMAVIDTLLAFHTAKNK